MSEAGTNRRDFLGTATTVAMAGGLAAGYGTFLYYAGRFLYPAGSTPTGWLFVTRVDDLALGASMPFRAPSGAEVVVTRREDGAFIALSSVCPHLGCQVHWQTQNKRFFCPCHNGVFDPDGNGTEGPPKGQSLLRYPLKVERGLLYIEVPLEQVAQTGGLERPGHDGCLKGL